jgi:hypothetical protein
MHGAIAVSATVSSISKSVRLFLTLNLTSVSRYPFRRLGNSEFVAAFCVACFIRKADDEEVDGDSWLMLESTTSCQGKKTTKHNTKKVQNCANDMSIAGKGARCSEANNDR